MDGDRSRNGSWKRWKDDWMGIEGMTDCEEDGMGDFYVIGFRMEGERGGMGGFKMTDAKVKGE